MTAEGQGIHIIVGLILYYVFKVVTVIVSIFCIYLGYRLFVLGVSGHASLVVNATSFSGQLVNAAPGLFFAVGGIVALLLIAWKGVKVRLGRHADFNIT